MNVIERVKKILFEPQTEWLVIDVERTTTLELYTGYIMPLAAIGPLAMLIGLSTMGVNVPFVGTMQVPFLSLVTQTIVTYVMGLVGVYVLALIVNALAPMFSGVGKMSQALKVAAYSATSAWVGGIFNLLPALSLLGVLAAVYTLYLLYLGLPVLMKSPPERAMGYAVTVVIAAVLLFVVIGVISSIFIVPPAAVTQNQGDPPMGKELEQLGKNLETFTQGVERGVGQTGNGARGSHGAPATTGDAVKAAGDTVKALEKVFSGGKTVEWWTNIALQTLLFAHCCSMKTHWLQDEL
jgi:hypothetical protein